MPTSEIDHGRNTEKTEACSGTSRGSHVQLLIAAAPAVRAGYACAMAKGAAADKPEFACLFNIATVRLCPLLQHLSSYRHLLSCRSAQPPALDFL